MATAVDLNDLELELAIEASKRTYIDEQKRSNERSSNENLMMIEDPKERCRREQIEHIMKICSNSSSTPIPENCSLTFFKEPAQQIRHSELQKNTRAQDLAILNPPPVKQLRNRNNSIDNGDLISLSPTDFKNFLITDIQELGPLSQKQRVDEKSATQGFSHDQNNINSRQSSYQRRDPTIENNVSELKRSSSFSKLPSSTEILNTIPSHPSCSSEQSSSAQCVKNSSIYTKQRKWPSRMLTFDDLRMKSESRCQLFQEINLLRKTVQSSKYQFHDATSSNDVFFCSPVVDYYVTTAETIKLIVHQDNSWPRDQPHSFSRLDFTCSRQTTCHDILIDVLARWLPQSELEMNNSEIPFKKFALKVYGTDEFLVEKAPIGKHTIVAYFFSQGKDVELEVGQRVLKHVSHGSVQLTPKDESFSKLPFTREIFTEFLSTVTKHVTPCFSNPSDVKLRQGIVQSIKMLTTFMNSIQPIDLISAIEQLTIATSVENLQWALHSVIESLLKLLKVYAISAPIDFHVENEEIVPAPIISSLSEDCSDCGLETRDSSQFGNEMFTFSIESIHNLNAGDWLLELQYSRFCIEVHLMYGQKSYANSISPTRRLAGLHIHSPLVFDPSQLYHFNHKSIGSNFVNSQYIHFAFWPELDIRIAQLPRESQLCFILRGLPILEPHDSMNLSPSATNLNLTKFIEETNTTFSYELDSTGNSTGHLPENWHHIAYASLPLFDYEGHLIQGPILLPLKKISPSYTRQNVVHPWGSRELIRSGEESVILIKFIEYDYNIRFPDIETPTLTEDHWHDTSEIVSQEDQEVLEMLLDADHSLLNNDERQLLWSNRNYLHKNGRALPLVLASAFSWAPFNLPNIYALLEKWTNVLPEDAIGMLLPHFPDAKVRSKSIHYICQQTDSEFVCQFIVQFVEALRYEIYEQSELALFLLQQSTKNRRFAFELYWQLNQRTVGNTNIAYSVRCRLLISLLLELGIPGFQDEINHQHRFLDQLTCIANDVKNAPDRSISIVLHSDLLKLSEEFDLRNIRIPTNPQWQCDGIIVTDCNYFKSLNKPIHLALKGRKTNYGIIYKIGDDLRQDAIVVQLIRIINEIWLSKQLDLRIMIYKVLPTGLDRGIIELVPRCSTLREIQVQIEGIRGVYSDDVVHKWLVRHNQEEFRYKQAVENFRRSCAGWAVISYVLGFGDRHNDNIMISTSGHVFHIDYGKYMGDKQRAIGINRDRVPFILVFQMVTVINEGNSKNKSTYFQQFIDDACKALNYLRQNSTLLLNIIRFMCCSDIKGMNIDSVAFVRSNLMLDVDDVQATMAFTRMIEETLRSKFQQLNFLAHTLAQHRQNLTTLITGTNDPNRFSFTAEIHTLESTTGGRIQSVNVIDIEKWYSPNKVYMFKMVVKFANEQVSSTIYRKYSEFVELYEKLCLRFSAKSIPPLSYTIQVWRKNIRAVASQQQVELQIFLERLLELHDEVSHSDLIYTFFHPLCRDSDPDAMRNIPNNTTCSDGLLLVDARTGLIDVPQIQLRLTLDTNNQTLRVFVGHARNIPLVGKDHTVPDTYAKLYLRLPQFVQLQKIFKRKTQIVSRSQNPTYNEELVYSLSSYLSLEKTIEEEIASMLLDVSIWCSAGQFVVNNFKLCQLYVTLDSFHRQRAVPSIISSAPNTNGTRRSGTALLSIENWYSMSIASN